MKRAARLDPAEIAVLGQALHSVAVEMGAALRRTAFSPNIKERRDYSSAVFSAEGDLIAMGDDMPVHLGSMPMSVAAVLATLILHPAMSPCSTIPFAAEPICPTSPWSRRCFFAGRTRAAFFVANRAHHADVGGMYPGSMGPCREIAQEGIRIPPVKLMSAGKMDRKFSDILANVRTPREREGDLTAQLGACRIGAERMLELVAPLWPCATSAGSERDDRRLRAPDAASPRHSPAGEWRAEDFLDDDGVIPGPIAIRVAVRNDPARRRAVVDFAGTARRSPAASTRSLRSRGRRSFMSFAACFPRAPSPPPA